MIVFLTNINICNGSQTVMNLMYVTVVEERYVLNISWVQGCKQAHNENGFTQSQETQET